MTSQRRIVWFSCGAASAVAAKETLNRYGSKHVEVVYCDTMASEHPDNQRFFNDVEAWLDVPIRRIKSEKYERVEDVFAARRYMSGIAGAPCTVEMKKVPRFDFQQADDIHIFGFTADEQKRIERFEVANFDLSLEWVLRDAGIDKAECFARLGDAGITLPAMYGLGYKNNNCLGCVKATSPVYWNAVRHDFPDVFAERARMSRELGARLVRVKGVRLFLDELPREQNDGIMEDISCGPDCAPETAWKCGDCDGAEPDPRHSPPFSPAAVGEYRHHQFNPQCLHGFGADESCDRCGRTSQ